MTDPPATQPEKPLTSAERQALRGMADRLARTDPDLAARLHGRAGRRYGMTALALGAALGTALIVLSASVLTAAVVLLVLSPCAWLIGRRLDGNTRDQEGRLH